MTETGVFLAVIFRFPVIRNKVFLLDDHDAILPQHKIYFFVVLLTQHKRIPRAIAIYLLVQNGSDDQKLYLVGTSCISSCARLWSAKLRLAMHKWWLLYPNGRHSRRSNQRSPIGKINWNLRLSTRIHRRWLWKCSATMQPSRSQMPQWSSLWFRPREELGVQLWPCRLHLKICGYNVPHTLHWILHWQVQTQLPAVILY